MNISVLFNTFIGGETSPLMAARIDSQTYAMGARRMENMIPMMTGGVRKRPGTWYVGTTKNNANARLIEWLLSDGTCVILEITAGTIRVWNEGNTMVQELSADYSSGQIAGIKYAASANNLWLVHSQKRPCKITWNGASFSKTEPTFTGKNFAVSNNFPGSAAFSAGRLCFAGTASEPNRIYMSKAPNSLTGEDRYTDFTAGDNPADAIVLEENDMQGSRLQWIFSNRSLLAATERATWSDTGEVPTPATFDMRIVEYSGANSLQAHGTKEIIVYAGRNGKTLRALVWTQSSESIGFIDMDISQYAAHLFTAGIRDIAVADYPYPIIWIVTNDGTLISCTINISMGVIAYARHPTDGIVEAAAVAHQTKGDVLYLVVGRGTERNIEYLILEDLVNEDPAESHYVDAGERRQYQTPVKTLIGLNRFAGKKIQIFADGSPEVPVEVNDQGVAHLQASAAKIHLGLPYKTILSPNTPQLPANGTSFGKKRRVEQVKLQLYKSIGGKAGVTEDKAEKIITQRFGSYVLGSAAEPYTGEVDITVSGNIDPECKLIIVHEEPAPFTILALVERIAILEA
ncbi:MAG: hypothetical protein LBS57_05645 [Treponema sp.]|jgi:hypothetical protein|nr:hypothetical protein [Treponema sp.]